MAGRMQGRVVLLGLSKFTVYSLNCSASLAQPLSQGMTLVQVQEWVLTRMWVGPLVWGDTGSRVPECWFEPQGWHSPAMWPWHFILLEFGLLTVKIGITMPGIIIWLWLHDSWCEQSVRHMSDWCLICAWDQTAFLRAWLCWHPGCLPLTCNTRLQSSDFYCHVLPLARTVAWDTCLVQERGTRAQNVPPWQKPNSVK